VIFCLHITPINILINNTPIRIRTWPGETDPNPNLARQNRSESEPGPAKPIRIRTLPGGTDPNPNLARRNRSESEPGKDETDPNPNSGKAIRTRGLAALVTHD
jgi:hypothetical protein